MGRLACSLDLSTCRSSASRLVLYTLSLSERYWISHPNAKFVETPTGWKKAAVVDYLQRMKHERRPRNSFTMCP